MQKMAHTYQKTITIYQGSYFPRQQLFLSKCNYIVWEEIAEQKQIKASEDGWKYPTEGQWPQTTLINWTYSR